MYHLGSILLFYIYLFTAIGFLPGGSGHFTCKQNMKLVATRFKSGGLHEKHVVATWNVGNRLSIWEPSQQCRISKVIACFTNEECVEFK